MQTGKKAVESVKETAANVAATARSGMEKTKATLQEKGEKMSAHSDVDKHMAEHRKEERIAVADLNKQEAKNQNAAQRAANTVPGGHHGPGAGGVTGLGGVTTTEHHSCSTTGEPGYTAGPQQMSAMPGHGTGHPTGGNVVEGTVGSHPIGKATGTARSTAAHNTRSGAGLNTGTTGQGTGGAYTG